MPVIVVPPDSTAPTRNYVNYDAYMDTLGLMFHEETETVYRNAALPLKPVRQDAGNNPNQIRPEYGDFFSQMSFKKGMYQEFFHLPSSDAHKYLFSEGLLPVDDRLVCLQASLQRTVPNAGGNSLLGGMAVVGSTLFVAETTSVRVITDLDNTASDTTEDPTGGDPNANVDHIIARGAQVFAITRDSPSSKIRTRSSAGVWSTYQIGGTDVNVGALAKRLLWGRDRLFATGGTNVRSIYEVATASPTSMLTLEEGWAWQGLFMLGPYLYGLAIDAFEWLSTTGVSRTRIYHFGLNSAATAMEVKGFSEHPGVGLLNGVGHLGSAYLIGGEYTRKGGTRSVLYQGLPDDNGFLALSKVAQGDSDTTTSSQSQVAIKPHGNLLYLAWAESSSAPFGTKARLAVYDPARAAFINSYVQPDNSSLRFFDIAFVSGRHVWATDARLYYQDPTNLVSSGTFISSVADWGNAGLKTWDQIEIIHRPLPAGSSIQCYYSTKHPYQDTWTLAGTSSTENSEGARFAITGVESRIAAVKIVLNRATDTTLAPELLGFSFRSNPTSSTDEWVLYRSFKISPKDRNQPYAQQRFYSDPDATRRQIEDMLRTNITYYEAQQSWSVRVESVDSQLIENPNYQTTQGEVSKKAYKVDVVMIGTRL